MRVRSSMRGVDVAVADAGVAAVAVVAAAVDPPATAVGDRGELLHVDVDQLAGPVPLVTPDRARSVARSPRSRRPTPGRSQDRLHRRGGQPDLDTRCGPRPSDACCRSCNTRGARCRRGPIR